MNKISMAGCCLQGRSACCRQRHPSFGGNVELDTDATSTELTDTAYDSGGRVKLQIDGRRDNGEYFAAAKGELLALVGGGSVAEDAWLMVGHTGSWNVRVGRYENEHMFPEGRDTVIVHATSVASGNAPVPYEMDAVRGRSDNGVRLRIQGVENWMLELGTFYGGGNNQEMFSGIRPVAVYSGEDITLRLGLETLDDGTSDLSGAGVSVGFNAGDASFNVNLTQLDNELGMFESTTFGANVLFNSIAIGFYQVDTDYDTGLDPSVSTLYASYSHMFGGIEDLYFTYAVSSSSSDDVATGSDDQVTAARLRLNYEF